TFTVKNVGKGAAQISVTVTGGIGNEFTATAPCPTLAVNATCTGTVTFRPTFPGTTFAQLSVTGSPGGTVTAPLLGTGPLGPFPQRGSFVLLGNRDNPLGRKGQTHIALWALSFEPSSDQRRGP